MGQVNRSFYLFNCFLLHSYCMGQKNFWFILDFLIKQKEQTYIDYQLTYIYLFYIFFLEMTENEQTLCSI